jgi:hypothetical protein
MKTKNTFAVLAALLSSPLLHADTLKTLEDQRKQKSEEFTQARERRIESTPRSVTPRVQRVWDQADANFNAALTSTGCTDSKSLEFLKKLNVRYKTVLATGEGRMLDMRNLSPTPDKNTKIRTHQVGPSGVIFALAGTSATVFAVMGFEDIASVAASNVARSASFVGAAFSFGYATGTFIKQSYTLDRIQPWVDFENQSTRELLALPDFEDGELARQLERIQSLPDAQARLESLQELYTRGNTKLRKARMRTAVQTNRVLSEAPTLGIGGDWAIDYKKDAATAALDVSRKSELRNALLEKQWLETLTRSALLSCAEVNRALTVNTIPQSAITEVVVTQRDPSNPPKFATQPSDLTAGAR